MMTPGTSTPLRNTQTVSAGNRQRASSRSDLDTVAENSTSSTGLFAALPSDTATICPTPPEPRTLLPAAKEAAANQPLPSNDAFKIPVRHIIKLIDEQIYRLEYEFKHAFFISKNLNRKKYKALMILKKDLHNTTFSTHDDLIQRLHQTSNDKDVVKGIIFRSKVKAMFDAIFAYLEKVKIHDITRDNDQKNILKNPNILTTLPLILQNKIVSYLSLEDTQAVLLTSRTTPLPHIIKLIDEQLNRLEHEFKHAFFISKRLNRTKHTALTILKKDLNETTFFTHDALIKRLHQTLKDKDVIKGIIFRSKVKAMFVSIFAYLEKVNIHDITRDNDQKNILKYSKKLTALPLSLQKKIVSYLNVEDTQAVLLTSRSFQCVQNVLKINHWRQKLVLIGIREDITQQLPGYIKFDILYHKIKRLTYNSSNKNRELELWMLAFLSRNEKFIQTVLSSNPDLQKTTSTGVNALHFAALGSNIKMFEHILKNSNINIDSISNIGSNSLHFAALGGNIKMFEHILKNSNINIDSKNKSGANALHFAALGGNIKMFEHILKNSNINIDSRNNLGSNTLHFAALGDNIKMFEHILKKSNINIDSSNNFGANTLHFAAWGGSIEISEHILKNSNIAIDSTDNLGNNILHFAGFGAHIHLVKYILQNSNIPIDSKSKQGNNILHHAAFGGHIHFIKYILQHSTITIDSSDKDGGNALHIAAQTGQVGLICFLRKIYNLNPSLQTSGSEDAFDIARSNLAGKHLASTLEALSTPVEEIPDSAFR